MTQKQRQMENIFIVEDDEALRELVANELEDRGYGVSTAADASSAVREIGRSNPDLIVSDLRLPDGNGFDVLEAARQHPDYPAVMLITGFGTVPQAVEALKAGADDFLTKPLDFEHLAVRVERVLAHRRTNVTLQGLRQSLRHAPEQQFHGMIGESDSMRALFEAIRRMAPIDEPVLISGESGSGKELVARAIHAESTRKHGPFVAINCASVPEALLEAEFFGHTANAFTGARSARRGLFAEAGGGTLFLDEIGEMPAALQAKLLRVLQEKRVRPLGGGEEIAVDARIVAATNRDIEAEIESGRWREDLYYRLETLSLHVPPLRERGEDRGVLVAHFLSALAAEREIPALRLSEDAFELIQAYPFPGNVRELANALSRAATFADSGRIEPRHLPARLRRAPSRENDMIDPLGLAASTPPTLAELESRYIRWILERNNGNKKRAAEILNVGRRTIYRKLDDFQP